MATAKSTTTAEIHDIQRRMAQVRHELHFGIREAVQGAQSWTDWRSQVRSHPWLALGGAAAAGYLIVPSRRRPEPPAIVAVSPAALGAAPPAPPERPPGPSRWGPLSTAMSLLAPIAVRAAQNSALHFLEQWLARPPSGGPTQTGPGPQPGRGAARPATPFGTPGSPREMR